MEVGTMVAGAHATASVPSSLLGSCSYMKMNMQGNHELGYRTTGLAIPQA